MIILRWSMVEYILHKLKRINLHAMFQIDLIGWTVINTLKGTVIEE